MGKKVSAEQSTLVELIKQCLHDNPCQRPSTEELLTGLQGMKGTLDQYGVPFRLDMEKVRLAKELKEKDRKMHELMQRQVRHIIKNGLASLASLSIIFLRLS